MSTIWILRGRHLSSIGIVLGASFGPDGGIICLSVCDHLGMLSVSFRDYSVATGKLAYPLATIVASFGYPQSIFGVSVEDHLATCLICFDHDQ